MSQRKTTVITITVTEEMVWPPVSGDADLDPSLPRKLTFPDDIFIVGMCHQQGKGHSQKYSCIEAVAAKAVLIDKA